MAKGLGLIGNFRGKFGNAVGYNLKNSNNKQTQGIRVYQPIVKNPKTYAQAEQRAKLAPINATYRVLKSVIDRGFEGVTYGNKSRLAWLTRALKNVDGVYANKGDVIKYPWLTEVSAGSLPGLSPTLDLETSKIELTVQGLTTQVTTLDRLSIALMGAFTGLQEGDQITFVLVTRSRDSMGASVHSFIVNKDFDAEIPSWMTIVEGKIQVGNGEAGCIIVSREGSNGQHLRSNAKLIPLSSGISGQIDEDVKKAAIRSYMTAGTSTDWHEDPSVIE